MSDRQKDWDRKVAALDDSVAIVAADFAVGEWIKANGVEALNIWQNIWQNFNDVSSKEGGTESWVLRPNESESQAATLSRDILTAFLKTGQTGNKFSFWAERGIEEATKPKAQFADPFSLLIFGSIAIGLVLAGRVETIGGDGVKFYQGLPPGISKIIMAVAGS